MTATWRATSQTIAYASGKSMLDVSQLSTGSRVLRVYRMYHFNNRASSVTGVLTQMRIYRTTVGASISGGATVTPVAHDTTSSALAADTTAGTGRTLTNSTLFRQYQYSTDEATVGGSTIDEWELFVPFAEVWQAGYGDTNVEPLTLRAAQGVNLHHQGTTAASDCDMEIEFTDAAS